MRNKIWWIFSWSEMVYYDDYWVRLFNVLDLWRVYVGYILYKVIFKVVVYGEVFFGIYCDCLLRVFC